MFEGLWYIQYLIKIDKFCKYWKLNLSWLERAFNSASFRIKTTSFFWTMKVISNTTESAYYLTKFDWFEFDSMQTCFSYIPFNKVREKKPDRNCDVLKTMFVITFFLLLQHDYFLQTRREKNIQFYFIFWRKKRKDFVKCLF